jgi:lipopolysaccharide export system permease protein
LIYVVYINLLFVARNWVEQKVLPISLGMWWVHLSVLLLSIGLFKRQLNINLLRRTP